MSEELLQPSVIDLEAMFQPIPGENPSGEYLRYSGLYDEVAEARRQDEDLNQGEWQTDLKVADYHRVKDLVSDALTSRTKDLQLAAWFTESLVKLHGFAGLRDGLLLLSGLQERFWDTLHPEIDEGDMEGRANAVTWLDTQGALAIKAVAFTGAAGYSFNDFLDSQKFDYPEDFDSFGSEELAKFRALKNEAESKHKVTKALWAKEIAATKRIAVERVNYAFEECYAALAELNKVVEEKYDRKQMPGLSNFRKTLDEIHQSVKKLLEEKRLEEPDAVDFEAETSDAAGGDGAGSGGRGRGGAQDRKEALRLLGEVAAYFQKNEPHSPVSYLVQRAVKWGNMPLEGWLQDVIKDESILSQVRQTLGFNTGGDTPEG